MSKLNLVPLLLQVLHERLLELSSKVEVLEGETANIHTQRRLEMKIKEVESKLELEQTTRQRLEVCTGEWRTYSSVTSLYTFLITNTRR